MLLVCTLFSMKILKMNDFLCGLNIHDENTISMCTDDNLSVMSAGFLLPSPDAAVIWRGPKVRRSFSLFLWVSIFPFTLFLSLSLLLYLSIYQLVAQWLCSKLRFWDSRLKLAQSDQIETPHLHLGTPCNWLCYLEKWTDQAAFERCWLGRTRHPTDWYAPR